MKKIPRLITNESVNMKNVYMVCDDNGNNLMKNNIVNSKCYEDQCCIQLMD